MPVHLPALILAMLLTAYWGASCDWFTRCANATAANANFAPPEPIGRLLRIIWIPAVLAWIIHPYLTGLFSQLPRVMRGFYNSNGVIGWIALAIALTAFGLTLVCWKRMGKSCAWASIRRKRRS